MSLLIKCYTGWQKWSEVSASLMHGRRRVGTAMLQLGKLLDLEMYGTASQSKLELVEDWAQRRSTTERRLRGSHPSPDRDGVDAAFDPIGGDQFQTVVRLRLRRGGKLVAYGFYNSTLGKGGSVPLDFMKIQLWNLWPNGRSPRSTRSADCGISSRLVFRGIWATVRSAGAGQDQAGHRSTTAIGRGQPRHELVEKAEVQGKIVLTVAGPAV